jgi:hypothetical protein
VNVAPLLVVPAGAPSGQPVGGLLRKTDWMTATTKTRKKQVKARAVSHHGAPIRTRTIARGVVRGTGQGEDQGGQGPVSRA